jgi:hypothetical protein
MEINFRELKRHYASLTDEELLDLDRDELTKAAQEAYDREIASRGLNEESPDARPEVGGEAKPDWEKGAVSTCSFVDLPKGSAAEKISRAQAALETAGIPHQLTVTRDEDSDQETVNVMVPLNLELHACAVIDRDLFNPEFEAEWRRHLSILSDEDMMALDPKIFCAAHLDRAERVRRAYIDEMQRRELPPRTE